MVVRPHEAVEFHMSFQSHIALMLIQFINKLARDEMYNSRDCWAIYEHADITEHIWVFHR